MDFACLFLSIVRVIVSGFDQTACDNLAHLCSNLNRNIVTDERYKNEMN